HREGRRNLHQADLEHALRVIEAKAMCNPGAAVVARNKESLIAEVPHRLDLIQCHRSKRVVDLTLATVGLAGIAIPSQVRYDDRVVARKIRDNLVPGYVRLRMTMNQQ